MGQMAAANPLDSIRSLLRMQSPTNMTPTGDAFVDKRKRQMATGEDELAPSELEQLETQVGLGDQGLGVSREMVRDDGIQSLKRKLGLIQAQGDADLRKVTEPARIKGQYDVQAAEKTAQAAEARAQTSQQAIAARQREQIDATDARTKMQIDASMGRQNDAQEFRGSRVAPGALTTIARERQHLADAIAKGEPTGLGKLFGKANPRGAELAAFDSALGAAQQIVSNFPDASAEEGLAQLGENQLTPDEIGQVQKFLLMLRGH